MTRRRLVAALSGALLALAGIVTFATPAMAVACPVYEGTYSDTTGALSDSYGRWVIPEYPNPNNAGFITKTGGTTCGNEVYVQNLEGPQAHPVYVRVWYWNTDFSVVNSHNPKLVNERTSNPDGTLVDLGPVSPGYHYQVQILAMSNTTGVIGAGCLNVIGGVNTPCFARSRG